MSAWVRAAPSEGKVSNKSAFTLAQVEGPDSLHGTAAKVGTVPTDIEQSTGLERLELLGKLEGVEVFDMSPLKAERIGTMANPIVIDSYDDFRYVGCTGSPAGSHEIQWLKPTTETVARCWECGSVYKLNPLAIPGAYPEHH
ncbi:COX5B-domain-containing protein [Nadsonia fulvescens var. elongata DSM 6958]|uniref:Cytochrome c oxidase subunit 4, mitochondrial n=1 Tax=Nadsonia fulvescens var. elongata DSM 6958 TaxID=857566 RepID=A0A1E3PTA1_9ASCO|nr:COX5B-domain-containing protein [Nadsonia fulvescens var. elongata DSM 6958]